MVDRSDTEKARYVSGMFGRIAGRYDWGNRVLSLGRDQSWRRRAVAALDPQPGDTVLDVGAGTGDLSLALARRARRVVAVDFSRPMLLEGARKARANRIGHRVSFVSGDALRLPFPDATFDGAAAAFTVRNLAPMGRGFSEVYRVLKPHGRLVCLEFTRPPSRLVDRLYRPYLNHLVPFIGGRIAGDGGAYRYLADSIQLFPTPQDLAQVIRDAGFPRVGWRLLSLGVVALHTAERSPEAARPQEAAA